MILNKKLILIAVAVFIPTLTAGTLVMGESLEKEEIAVSPTPTIEPTPEPIVEPTEAPIATPTVEYVPPVTVAPTVAVSEAPKPTEAPKAGQITVCHGGTCQTVQNQSQSTERQDGSSAIHVEVSNSTPDPNTIQVSNP